MCVTVSATPIAANNLSGVPGNSPSSVRSSNDAVFKEDMPALLDQPDSLAALEESDSFDRFLGEMGNPVMRAMSCDDDGDRGVASEDPEM